MDASAGSVLATPTSQAAKHGATPDTTANAYGKNLWDLPHLLPTPNASEPGYTGPMVDMDGNPVEHVAQRCYDPVTGRLVQTGVSQAVRLLPTPTARDWKDGRPCENVEENALLGRTVWRLTSDPTPTPSPDGNPLSDDPHPTPPTTSDD
jgi:hypothetical protein